MVEGDTLRVRDRDVGMVADAFAADQSGSQWSINILLTAMEELDERRSYVGTSMNRLLSALSFGQDRTIQLSHARSTLEDADIAEETIAQTRAQILSQAASSLLAQVKAMRPNILTLLGK